MNLHNERRNTNASPTSVRYISKFTDSSNASYMKPASEVSMNLSYDSSPTSIRYVSQFVDLHASQFVDSHVSQFVDSNVEHMKPALKDRSIKLSYNGMDPLYNDNFIPYQPPFCEPIGPKYSNGMVFYPHPNNCKPSTNINYDVNYKKDDIKNIEYVNNNDTVQQQPSSFIDFHQQQLDRINETENVSIETICGQDDEKGFPLVPDEFLGGILNVESINEEEENSSDFELILTDLHLNEHIVRCSERITFMDLLSQLNGKYNKLYLNNIEIYDSSKHLEIYSYFTSFGLIENERNEGKLPRVTLHVDGRPNGNDIRKEFINNDELSDEWEFIYNVKTEHVEKEATKVIHRVLRSKRNGRLYALFNSRVQKCNFDSVKDNTNGFGGIFYAYEIYKSDDDGKYYSEKAFCSKYKQIYEEKLYIVKLMNLDDIEKSRKIMQAKSTHQANASNDDPENTPPFAANEEDPWNEIAINILLKKCPHENIIKMEQYGIIGKIFDDPSEFSDGNVVNLNVTNIEQNYLFMILECAEVGDAFSSKISNIKRSEKLCEIFVHILKAVKQ